MVSFNLFTMFPKCKIIMERIHGRKFIYLNHNVVNTVYDGEFDIKENIIKRTNSNIILLLVTLNIKQLQKSLHMLLKNFTKTTII